MAHDTNEFDDLAATRKLLEFMTSAGYRPMLQREILHNAHVSGPDRPGFRRLLRRLIRQGRIRKLRGGRLVAVGPSDGAPARTPVKAHSPVLGVFSVRGRGGVVQPLERERSEPIQIAPAHAMGAEDLQAVSVEILKPARDGRPGEGKVVELLGHIDDPGVDVLLVTRKRSLAESFPTEVRKQARSLPVHIGAEEMAGRERFDDPPPVTIDGESARDFDDAIAVREIAGGGFRLWVHIADVAHFVPVGSPLDLEARRRGTSVYFPDRVIPMLPEELSNHLCSLVPGKDRLVQTVILDFTKTGKLRKVRFADGVIRSAARLTYTQVADVLSGTERGLGVHGRVVPMLHTANRLRHAIEQRRHARGSIDFDLPEPQVLLDVEGAMTGITIRPRNLAHRMIEEFMIAANEAVAEHLSSKGASAIYRVHDAPDPVKLDALVKFVEGFGHELRAHDAETVSKEIQQLLERVDSRPEERVINQVALRTMNQARYSPSNSGHFALGAPSYGHFTSPIRRYPDLVVHRQLRGWRQKPKSSPHPRETLEGIAESSSALERNAEAAERELLNWKKVAFIAEHVGDVFDGIVTGVTRFGLFVQLVENLVEGLVRIELLGAEWFDFDERRFQLVGSQSNATYRLGDPLRVRVARVDRVLQRVDFSLEATRAGARRPAPRRSRGAAGDRRRGKIARRR